MTTLLRNHIIYLVQLQTEKTINNSTNNLDLVKGKHYKFIATQSGHPFNVGDSWRQNNTGINVTSSTNTNLVNGAGSIDNSSIDNNNEISFYIPDDYDGTFKYYCYLHSNMIKDFNIISEQDSEPEPEPESEPIVSRDCIVKVSGDVVTEGQNVYGNIIINHNPSPRIPGRGIFYAQNKDDQNNNGGYDGKHNGSELNVITMEASHLTLTTEIMEELKMNEYSDGIINSSSSSSSYYSGKTWTDFENEVVNIYMVYLNSEDDVNYRSSIGNTIEFENEIIGLGIKPEETLYFSNSIFEENQYPIISSNRVGKRYFEPSDYNSGQYQETWNLRPGEKIGKKKTNGNDWYKITAGENSSVNNVIEFGFKNASAGDFIRVITKCSPTIENTRDINISEIDNSFISTTQNFNYEILRRTNPDAISSTYYANDYQISKDL